MRSDRVPEPDAEAALSARRRFVALAVLWMVVVGTGVVVLGAQAHGLGCDSPRSDARFDSTVGTTHVRWWPFGVECVYTRTENGVDRREEPGPVPSAWALVSVVLGTAVVLSFRATRARVLRATVGREARAEPAASDTA